MPSMSKLQKRLWMCGLGLALFIATIIVGNFFISTDKQVTTKNAGHDFLAFYTAGTFLREGRVSELYDLEKVKAFEQGLAQREGLELKEGFGPFWNPPVFAWVFVPLAGMSYTSAWWAWFAVNMSCAVAAIALMWDILNVPRASQWGLIPLLVIVSLPFIQALGHGQNTCFSLLILSGVVWFWRKGHGMWAGMICGLLFYKPQLAAVVAGILCITLGWRAMVGLAITGIALLAISETTMPGATRLWAERLPEFVKYMQIDHRYMWERHVTLKAFWRLFIQGYEIGNTRPAAVLLWVISIAALALGMTLAVVRTLTGLGSRDRLIAATITSMPLLMPFYFDYDLLLLAVPAVVFAAERMRENVTRPIDRAIIASWAALFAWMFVNPFVAGQTHVNGTVLLLSALSGMLVARACGQPVAQRDEQISRHLAPPLVFDAEASRSAA